MFKLLSLALPEVAYMEEGCCNSAAEWKKLEEE